jgi:hypothetical protein
MEFFLMLYRDKKEVEKTMEETKANVDNLSTKLNGIL